MESEAQGNAAVLSALFGELDRLGVGEFCVAAGARNAPIVAALNDRGRKVRHFFDERSAGFFALGRLMAGARPVAVVTTSGTAAGELLPAMMEAYYQGLGLIVITADRPSRYQGSGAPQAVEQSGIFGPYATWRWEGKWLVDHELRPATLGEAMSSTMHFNVRLEEEPAKALRLPSGGTSGHDEVVKARVARILHAWSANSRSAFQEVDGGLVVLVAGLRPGSEVSTVREFLLKLNAPIVAEATSNLLGDEALQGLLVPGGERALQMLNARRVLRIGAVPSWRWWRDLEDREEVCVVNASRAPFRGLARTASVTAAPLEKLADLPIKASPLAAGTVDEMLKSVRDGLSKLLDAYPHSEPAWMRHLSRLIPAGVTVFLGNSLPIREWNLAADRPKNGTRFFANRGANGIDGLISSGFGVGAEAAETWIVVGDLSALYDMNAPWILPQLKNRKWRIVVINNGGGKIFSRVAWLRDLPEAVQEMVENRHALNFEHWARMWNLDYRRFDEASSLADDDSRCAVWEIVPDAAQTESFWAEWK